MKPQRVFVLVCTFIFGIFIFWQFNLYQQFFKKPLSCGDDWSYNIQCPTGSYCKSARLGSLAGGSCRPFISFFNIFKSTTSVENLPTLIPPTQLPSAEVSIQYKVNKKFVCLHHPLKHCCQMKA